MAGKGYEDRNNTSVGVGGCQLEDRSKVYSHLVSALISVYWPYRIARLTDVNDTIPVLKITKIKPDSFFVEIFSCTLLGL